MLGFFQALVRLTKVNTEWKFVLHKTHNTAIVITIASFGGLFELLQHFSAHLSVYLLPISIFILGLLTVFLYVKMLIVMRGQTERPPCYAAVFTTAVTNLALLALLWLPHSALRLLHIPSPRTHTVSDYILDFLHILFCGAYFFSQRDFVKLTNSVSPADTVGYSSTTSHVSVLSSQPIDPVERTSVHLVPPPTPSDCSNLILPSSLEIAHHNIEQWINNSSFRLLSSLNSRLSQSSYSLSDTESIHNNRRAISARHPFDRSLTLRSLTDFPAHNANVLVTTPVWRLFCKDELHICFISIQLTKRPSTGVQWFCNFIWYSHLMNVKTDDRSHYRIRR